MASKNRKAATPVGAHEKEVRRMNRGARAELIADDLRSLAAIGQRRTSADTDGRSRPSRETSHAGALRQQAQADRRSARLDPTTS